MAKKKKTKSPATKAPFIYDGSQKTTSVAVIKTEEEWGIYKLVDGTELKIKPVIIQIKKVIGKYNPNGDPIYVVHGGIAVDAKVPPRLKKKKR
jgi:hypothetical protein